MNTDQDAARAIVASMYFNNREQCVSVVAAALRAERGKVWSEVASFCYGHLARTDIAQPVKEALERMLEWVKRRKAQEVGDE